MIRFLLPLLVVASASSPALAQPRPQDVTLEGHVKLERVVEIDGRRQTISEEPKVVVPGDKLLFSTRYKNESHERVVDLVVTNPVPLAVRVSDDSVRNLYVSVDGGNRYDLIGNLIVKGADGTMRAATTSDITHVRWTVPVIAPGASGAVEYHAIVR